MRAKLSRSRLVLVVAGLIVAGFLLAMILPKDLVAVPANGNFEISVECTVGTNHVFYFGGRSPDRLFEHLMNRDAWRLRYQCEEARTAVWIRVVEREDARKRTPGGAGTLERFAEGGYESLLARLVDKDGTETILKSTGQSRYVTPTSNTGGHVEGWLLNGSLEEHRGGVLHIESPEGLAIGTVHLR